MTYYYLKDERFNYATIVLGSSLPKSGMMSKWGESVESGANAYIKYVNENQVLKNKKISLLIYDDKYEPTLTQENINKFIKNDHIFALFGFVGTPTVKNILPILEESKLPFIAPFTGGEFLRNSFNENFVNFRSSYKEEIEKLVDYLYTVKHLDKIAVFYQNDDYGEEGYISLIQALKKRNLPLVAEGTYKRNTLSIRHAFNEIKDAKPEAIIMVGAYKANALFIKKAKVHPNFKDTLFCNLSFSDANAMIKELNFKTQHLLFSQVVPSYDNKNIPVIQEYRTLMKKYYPEQPLGFISLEAFLAAKTMVNALKNIQGNITRKKFLHALKTLPTNQLSGLKTQFKNSQLLNTVYLFEYNDSSFKEIKYEN